MAREQGVAFELPKKRPKAIKPVRYGTAYFAQQKDGAVLLETRPAKGLLGGMLALPSTEWSEGDILEAPPIHADWVTLPTPVKHTFTHFHLVLTVKVVSVHAETIPTRGQFEIADSAIADKLPTVMRKAYIAGMAANEG